MQHEYKSILSEAFTDVLMNYAFMFGDEFPKDDIPVDGDDYVNATVLFRGHRSGAIGVSTSTDVCLELAANILGVEQDDAAVMDDTSDALRELINIVCGQFLTSAFGEKPVFDLSPPSILQISKEEWNELIESEETIGFMIDTSPVVIYVSVGQETDDDSSSGC